MLYVGSFTIDRERSDKQKDIGSFVVCAEANDVEAAAEVFHRYLVDFATRSDSQMFSGKTKVFLDDIAELPQPLSRPALLHYRSRHHEGVFAEIGCGLIDGPKRARNYGWGDPKQDEHEPDPFLEFEPRPKLVMRAKGKNPPASPGRRQSSKRDAARSTARRRAQSKGP